MNILVPGLPDGWVDSLREAAENSERERAQVLVADLHRLMRQHPAMDVQAVATALKIEVLSPLTGDERRRAEAFLDGLGIGNI
ncbi:hypothetical protein ACQZ32_03160 [Ralstonia pseudosolanacearum]|uniref:hypothetical protein n=1 Tax=Ralstonia pseudosolanacearum TaxID=1310165 RepID=UPI0012DAD80E|nr:hypothetical protein [Ralstonia pseudosolanacearum]MDD7787807.1 hypothetical protein [Ralstonia pseudosolanacearum]MDN3369427.1 hypothetical protein [Ralstonia pseudosolanacearum]QOK89132.1 hypothetical protein HF907_21145 [Ralstonia pseudosolanacearum]